MSEAFGAKSKAKSGAGGVTVSFGERFVASGQFDLIFKEGMGLVERAACYLDGRGRKESKALAPAAVMGYATESMRLTTRLLDLASWLLVRRALNDGLISEDEARAKRRKLNIGSIGRPSHVKSFDDLPEALRRLIEASFALQDRIVQLDRAIDGGVDAALAGPAAPQANSVGAQMARIEAAFGRS